MSRGGVVTTLGTVPGVRSTDTERGLLGIAVDPNFPSSPYIYIHATDNRFGTLIAISRFTLTGDLADTGTGALAFDPASRYDLIRNLPDVVSNHNGGTVRFGTGRTLYVSIGDDANNCNARLVGVLAGKILRLDVSRLPAGPGDPAPYALLTAAGNPFAANTDSLSPRVWASGLRNPFRFHVDPLTNDLFVGDVGENTWEEVTRFSAGGQNAGWPWREGPVAWSTCSGSQPAVVAPIVSYTHSDGVVVISGGVYRRPATGNVRFPLEYDGNYFFLDYYSGFMRRLSGSGSSWAAGPAATGQPNATDWASGMENVSDVLLMPDGSLLYARQSENSVALTGEIRRIANPVTLGVMPSPRASLSFAAPNPTPSRGPVALRWSQSTAAAARVTIYDVAGRTLRVVADRAPLIAGSHERSWDGNDSNGAAVAAGLYFAQLEVAGEVRRTRILLLR